MSLHPSPACQQIFETRIFESKPIAQNQWSVWLKAEGELPDFLPGNFCMLSLPDFADPLTPRPFAIVDKKDGMYQFIYRVVGKFTRLMVSLPVGKRVSVLGPLGKGVPRELLSKSKSVFIAGGVGYASLLPLLGAVSAGGGVPAGVFYGVRTDLEIIRKSKFKPEYSSDDGTAGFKGRISDLLKSRRGVWDQADSYYVCGPTPMMKAVYDLLPPEKSFYFLEETMGCGVGICIGCVVSVAEDGVQKRVRSCVEGPIFRGSLLKPWREGV